jgi:uncharacterized protein YbjT (DUF2867 family)
MLVLEGRNHMTTQAKTMQTTLILGGAGKTGRRVAQRLTARGLPVRMASRSGDVRFDWHDERTWPGALVGADAAYLTYYPDLAAPGAAEHIGRFSRLAVERGVRKLVLLAGRGEPMVAPAEQAVRDSGASFTILEAAFFCQNFSEGVLVPVDGEIVFPAGEIAEPFIDCDDIADVAVEALLDDAHAGKTLELTGPRLVTFGEAAAEIARASGRDVRYVPVSFERYAELLGAVMPADDVAFLIDLFRHILDGHNAHTTDGVARVLGRPARDVRSYAKAAAASGAWQP